jgi:hypothetical protein
MSIVDLLTGTLIDLPVFDLTPFGSNQDIVFIDLVQFSWLVAKLELFDIVLSSRLEIHDSDVHNALLVHRETEYCCRTLYNRLVPLNLDHAVSLRRDSTALVLLDNYYNWFLLFDGVAILINSLLVLIIWILSDGLWLLGWWGWGLLFDGLSISVLDLALILINIINRENFVGMWRR